MRRLDADRDGPVRCATIGGPPSIWAPTMAELTGLTLVQASELIDSHIVRGTD